MDFLSFFDLEDRPALKYGIITFIVVNAIVLALLVFRPGLFSSGGRAASSSAEVQQEGPGEDDSSDHSGLSGNMEDGEDEEDAGDSDTSSTASTAEEAEEDEKPESGPWLVLTTDHATLHVGDVFNFYDYIRTMEDSDGSSLSRYIHLTGDVNTRVPGDYQITYRITSPIDGRTASKDLLITVEP